MWSAGIFFSWTFPLNKLCIDFEWWFSWSSGWFCLFFALFFLVYFVVVVIVSYSLFFILLGFIVIQCRTTCAIGDLTDLFQYVFRNGLDAFLVFCWVCIVRVVLKKSNNKLIGINRLNNNNKLQSNFNNGYRVDTQKERKQNHPETKEYK